MLFFNGFIFLNIKNILPRIYTHQHTTLAAYEL